MLQLKKRENLCQHSTLLVKASIDKIKTMSKSRIQAMSTCCWSSMGSLNLLLLGKRIIITRIAWTTCMGTPNP